MADVGDSDDEDYSGCDGRADDSPDRPDEATARIADSEHRYANTCFDRNRASTVEELSDKEELAMLVLSL